MSQLLGQSGPAGPVVASDAGEAAAAAGAQSPPVMGAEQAFFHVDVKRSLRQHWRLARAVALGGAVLAIAFVLFQVYVKKAWPTYMAESIVYIQPAPARVLPSDGAAPRWPYDTNTYESYIQQQMMNVSRDDVLMNAVHKLPGFQGAGEGDESAAQRLVRSLEVKREGTAFQFSISARAGTPELAAAMANAVTASYIEGSSRDERTGDAQRQQMLREEKERIQKALAEDHEEQEVLNRQLGVASVSTTVPNHYDEDITQIRTDLARARTDHDVAEQKFVALGGGQATSPAIDAAADELIASDAGLVSMKTTLNTRRATLISQMANLTPANPQYKQDEVELGRINSTLDAMMKELRAKAAARIQAQIRTDLQRTAGVEAQLNGQLRQLAGAASGATPKMQRSGDLAADITRLQSRYALVDEQLHNLLLEDGAPSAAYQVTPAVAPIYRAKTGVLRNAILIFLAGLFFAVAAAVCAHKLDPRIYIAADAEQVLGFAPLAQLPDFGEVSAGVPEEYLLRLASAIEHGRRQGDLKNCLFTGTGPGTGVSTLVTRISEILEAMGRPTVLVDATGAPPPAPRIGAGSGEGAQGLVPVQKASRPTALLQQMAEETETQEGSLVLTDTAPLTVSAETEYLARFVDCAIVVIESGVTTRAELREAADLLQRLNVGAVAFVLNRVRLATADAAFRLSVEAVEKHLQAQSSNEAARTERSAAFAQEAAADRETGAQEQSVRAKFEPEIAAAAAAVARFSPRAAHGPAVPQVDCLATPTVASASTDAARRFSYPFAEPAPAKPLKAASAQGADSPQAAPAAPVAPFAEAAQHFASAQGEAHPAPFPSRPVAVSAASSPLPVGPAEPFVPAIPLAPPAFARIPEAPTVPAPAASEPAAPEAKPAEDLPWWLSEAPRHAEPVRPPVLWQPAKIWTAHQQETEAEPLAGQASLSPEAAQTGAPVAETALTPMKAQESALEETSGNRASRLSGLRNLLFVLGVKDEQEGADAGERTEGGPGFEPRNGRGSQERTIEQILEAAPGIGRGTAARQVTAAPEFLPPKPVVIEFHKADSNLSDSSARQDRRASADGVEILPSKRGQYKKI